MLRGKKRLVLLIISVVLMVPLAVGSLLTQGTLADPADVAPRYGRLNAERFVDVSIGYYFGGALDENGVVWVWGQNGSGQLGNGQSISTTTGQGYAGALQPVPDLPQIRQFSAGESYGMALDYNGDVYSWGYNAEWQCGGLFKAGGNAVQRLPIKLDREAYGIPRIEKVDAGVFHSAAIDQNGAVWCWGLNNAGQLGNGKSGRPSNYKENIPTKAIFPEGTVIIDVNAGRDNTVALDSDGNVWCWGRNSLAECANGKKTFVPTPSKVVFPAGTPRIYQVSLVNGWVLALDEAGTVWQWGKVYGQKAFASVTYLTAPEIVEFDSSARIVAPTKKTEKAKFAYDSTYEYPGTASIHAGHRSSYVVDNNGKIWTWGDNEFYGFGMVTDYYAADYCRVPIWSKKAVQSPTITGNGDQNVSGNQLSFLHPQVSGSASDPMTHPEYRKQTFATGFWNEKGIGIDPQYAEVPMPYAQKIVTFCSSYVVLDADGNLWTWSYDSIGTICWGTEPMQEPLPSHAKWKDSGLWDLFIYEPALMRGAGKYVEQAKVITGNWNNLINGVATVTNNTYSGDFSSNPVVETGVRYSLDDPTLASPTYIAGSTLNSPFDAWLVEVRSGDRYYQAYIKTQDGTYYYGEIKALITAGG